MSEFGLRTRMLVKDVMSSPVVTAEEDQTTDKVAAAMDKEGSRSSNSHQQSKENQSAS